MIKNIFLHIGVHKTASTTIQNTFYTERAKLAEAGILYPEFKAGDIPISNHSIPFYSLFMEQPEKFHFNVSNGFTTDDALRHLHQEYHRQFQEQIVGFAVDTLVMSGEDISHLTTDELEKLNAYLLEITQPEVNIRVIMMCRHPVSRFRSALQGSVCTFGLPMEKAIERNLRRTNLYQNLITAFSEVFEREHITVLKYEDSISHSYGPAGAFLALVDKDLPEKIKPALLHDNPTRNYETFVLLNAINQSCYHTSDYELQPQRMVELNNLFREMPGRKFMLPQGLSIKAWDALSEDVNWLCREFSLPEYRFLDEDLKPDAEIWNRRTLDFVDAIIPRLQPEDRNTVINLLNEVKFNPQMSNRKKIYISEQTDILIKQIRNSNLTYLSEKRLQSIASTCVETEESEIPGVFIEAGCALGGSSILIAASKTQKRKLFIYDVFGMIPSPSENDPAEVHDRFTTILEGKSAGIGGEKYYGYVENLLEVVKSNLKSFGIDDEKQSVSFIKGLIQETMKINEPVAFAHIDVDWYEPVLFCLETIFPDLSVGGSIIIDDYHDWGGCRKATDEYLSKVVGQYDADDAAGSLKITRIRPNQQITTPIEQGTKTENYNEINLEEFLKKFSGQKVVYCANPGNAGDAMIAHGTFKLFEKLKINPKIITHTQTEEGQTTFYAGGGNLVEGKYKNAFNFIKNNYAQNKEIILLPHTVYGYNDLLLSAPNLTIICREKQSYDYLAVIGFPKNRLFLAHDMAFLLGCDEFSQFTNEGNGTANCFRTDFESLNVIGLPENNLDISLSWNGELWHRPEFAKNVTHNLACYLSAFKIVKTDRLHIAMLAAMMGKQVIMYPNNYYKNKAVFDYSIKGKFNNVSFLEKGNSGVQLALKPDKSNYSDTIKKLESELLFKASYIADLEVEKKKLDGVLKSKSWKITKPLRYFVSLLKCQ